MASQHKVDVLVQLRDKASKQMKTLSQNTRSWGESMRKSGLLVAGMASVLGGGLFAVSRMAQAQDDAMIRLIATLGSVGVAYEDVKGDVSDTIDSLRKTTGKSTADIAGVFATLIQRTGDWREAVKLLPVVLDTAAGRNVSLEEATRNVANATLLATGTLVEEFPALRDAANEGERLNKIMELYGGQAEANRDSTQALTSSLAELAVGLGINDIVNSVADAISGFVEKINGFNPGLVKAFGIALAGVFVGLTVGAVIAGIAALGSVALIVIGISAAVGVLIAGIVLLVQNWDAVSTKIKAIFDSKWAWLFPLPKLIWEIGQRWDTVWSGIKAVASTVWSGIKALYTSNLGWILPGGALFKGLSLLKGHWKDIFGAIGGFVSGTFDLILSRTRTGVNAFIDLLNVLIRTMNKIKITIPNIRGLPGRGKEFGINISEIPRLAKGGIVTSPTLALIGESGPEAVVPLGPGGGRGQGGGGDLIVNVNFPPGSTVILDNEMSARRLGQALVPLIQQTLRTQRGF